MGRGDEGVARVENGGAALQPLPSGSRDARLDASQFAFSPRLTLFCLDARANLVLVRLDSERAHHVRHRRRRD